MNLHGIVSGAIGTVNPFTDVTILRSAGYVTDPDGTRVPAYETFTGPAQVQDLSSDDLNLLTEAGFAIQGSRKNIYLNGAWAGIVRADKQGGDIFQFDNADWLVTMVTEQWPDWCKVIVTMQSPRPPTLAPLRLVHRRDP